MSDNPYTDLGLSKTATADEIKKAWRRLVRTSHPDLNPDDSNAEETFKAVSSAYELLRDPEKRARFDAGEIDATGAEMPSRKFYRDYADAQGGGFGRQGGFDPGQGDPSDLFAEILRQRRQQGGASHGPEFSARGADLRYTLDISLLDAVRGAKTRVTLPEGGNLEVTIPPGTLDGQTLRLRGKGRPPHGRGMPGDALVSLSVGVHPVFSREGGDILVTLPITFDEAVLGAKVMAPTIDGPVTLTIPKGANSGQVLRLRKRGVMQGKSGDRGDQLVALRIMAPVDSDPELEAFLETWRTTRSYDPRKGMMT
jgi:DnaJ-class molecular chaperone